MPFILLIIPYLLNVIRIIMAEFELFTKYHNVMLLEINSL